MVVDDLGWKVKWVAIQFIVLAVGSFGLRVYVRASMVKAWGWDDWLMTFAFIMFLFFMSNILVGVNHGIGRRFNDLSYSDIELALKFWIFSYIWYSWTMMLSKLSIAIFLLRIVVTRTYRWILYGTMVISVMTGLVFFFVMLFQCFPVDYFWLRDPTMNGKCMSVDVIINVTYAYSALNILCDFTLALLPVTIVWGLHMPFKMKLATVPLLSMGCVASTGVVLRLIYVQNYRQTDFLYATVEIAVWSVVEAGLAITAGSLACVRPLFKLALQRLGLSTSSEPFAGRSSHYVLPGGPASASAAASRRPSHRATMYNSSELLVSSPRKGGAPGAAGRGGEVLYGGGGGGKGGEVIPMGNMHGALGSPIQVKVEQEDVASTTTTDGTGSQAGSRADSSSHADVDRREPTTNFV